VWKKGLLEMEMEIEQQAENLKVMEREMVMG
jgi:hypothetical protein